MVYITGDTHGNLSRIEDFCNTHKTSTDDIMIILGDTGFNYYLNRKDRKLKEKASQLPITIFCIRGNHEERPQNVDGYITDVFCGDTIYYQTEYPNIKFAIDGGMYNFNSKKCLTIGGAYSVDKFYRIMNGWQWFSSEQLSFDEMNQVEKRIFATNKIFDYVLTHTCPYNTRPTHLFLPGIDQSKVDTSMEEWFESIALTIIFNKWYFGHYHDNWKNGKYKMLYDDIIELGE